MGFEGVYSIYRKKNNTYEKLALYDKDGNELESIFPYCDHMLNQLLIGYNTHGYSFEAIGARRGLPKFYIDDLVKEYGDRLNVQESLEFFKQGTWYDYTELRGWRDNSYCDILDEDTMEDYAGDDEYLLFSKPTRNPLKEFMNIVDFYLATYGIISPMPGDIIIVCEPSY